MWFFIHNYIIMSDASISFNPNKVSLSASLGNVASPLMAQWVTIMTFGKNLKSKFQ